MAFQYLTNVPLEEARGAYSEALFSEGFQAGNRIRSRDCILRQDHGCAGLRSDLCAALSRERNGRHRAEGRTGLSAPARPHPSP